MTILITNITAPLIVDDKYLGMIQAYSSTRSPDRFNKDLVKAIESAYKSGQGVRVTTVVDHLYTMGWDTAKAIDTKALMVTTPRKDEVATIEWSVDDVIDNAKQHGKKLSRNRAKEILWNTINHHDCEYGISWGSFAIQ